MSTQRHAQPPDHHSNQLFSQTHTSTLLTLTLCKLLTTLTRRAGCEPAAREWSIEGWLSRKFRSPLRAYFERVGLACGVYYCWSSCWVVTSCSWDPWVSWGVIILPCVFLAPKDADAVPWSSSRFFNSFIRTLSMAACSLNTSVLLANLFS